MLSYDNNEPCCGEVQCDRESTATKSIIRSFIGSGNDLLNGDDLFKALHYGYGIKDTKVASIQLDNTNTVITGITQKYSSIMNIKTSAKILKSFSNAESIQRKKKQFSKKREGRTLNNILYCSTAGYAERFDETSKLEDHMLSGKHSIPEEISSFDLVKKSFTRRMKLTSHKHHPTSSSASTNSDGTVS